MGVLTGLEPAAVFHFFEEICQIPHGSGNVSQISDYLKQFALDRKLFCIQDEWKNIIIMKEATEGYEQEEPFILQGHMDMVAVKKADCCIDLLTEPLRLVRDENRIYAEGTSLGGDDGIAVAYALALLDAKEIAHPKLEVVLTVDEEVGLDGAKAIDLSMLEGKRMVNIDQEEEGVLLVSCAGGASVNVHLPVEWEKNKWEQAKKVRLSIGGLQGGHSGTEIIREGGNADCLMGRVLYELTRVSEIGLAGLKGGSADNAIPREAEAFFLVAEKELAKVKVAVEEIAETIKGEYGAKEPDLSITLSVISGGTQEQAGRAEVKAKAEEQAAGYASALTAESAQRAINCLLALPNGVQAMSADVEGMVETSLNLGIMKLSREGLRLEYAIRSSVESAKKALCAKVQAVASLAGGSVVIQGEYPGWAYRKDSPLREKMIRVYEQLFLEKPKVQAIHAGLECGILAEKIQGLDCISIGPDMASVHTAEESMDIASVQRTWNYLLAVLAEKEK